MHYRQYKRIINNAKGHLHFNLYRGCSHGCIYCDSRSRCYQINHPFEDIEIKTNAPQMVEQELASKRQKKMITTGSMSDPYLPIEKDLEYLRQILEHVYHYHFGIAVLTKSCLVLRDLEILKAINQRSKAVVQMTLTTYDETLCKILEPNVDTTYQRYLALKTFSEHQIPTIVWFGPILPMINDTVDNLMGILKYCIKAKVKGILSFGFGLTLREGNREYFYQQLDQYFPGLKEKYQQRYGDRYNINSDHHKYLNSLFIYTCQKFNIMYQPDQIFAYLASFEK